MKILLIEMLADRNFPEFGHACHIPVLLIFLLIFNELAQYIVSVCFPCLSVTIFYGS